MKEFRRRFCSRPAQALADLWSVVLAFVHGRRGMPGDGLDPAFRERLMLAVTQVNGCRYCSYAHARMALVAGIPPGEIEAIGRGTFAGSPPDQVPALLYAQHWAEADGTPEADVRARVAATYGESRLKQMELAMRMIRVANLLGNTWDYLLFRLSRGRWGG